MARGRIPPQQCPVCGESVPPSATACPGCGADERTGWNEEATRYDGLDLPDHAFEGDGPKRRARPRTSFWPVVAWVLLAAVVLSLVFF